MANKNHGFGDIIKIERIGYEVLKPNDLIEDSRIPGGLGFVTHARPYRMADGPLITSYLVRCC